jgi:glycosyltransferase
MKIPTVKKLNLFSALKIASPTIFIKKNIAKIHRYNTSYSISSDTDFNLRLSQKKLNFFYLDKYIIFMRIGGISTNYKLFLLKMIQDIKILKKYFKITFGFIYIYKILIKLKTLSLKKIFYTNVY